MTHKSLLMATMLLGFASPAFAQQAPMPPPGAGQAQQRPSAFERADSNRDGEITREEVRVVRTTAFTRLDANRDGFLVREEMPRPNPNRRGGPANDPQRIQVSSTRIDYMRADANKDGTISRAEFEATFPNTQSSNTAEVPAYRPSIFPILDADNNGSLSQSELAAHAARSGRPPKQRQPNEVTPSGEPMRRGGGPPRQNPDTNNDQKISLAEWLARPDPLFDRGDVNRDGRVTRDEAAAIVRQGRGDGGRSMRPW